MTQDLEERTRHLKMKMKLAQQDRQRTLTSSSGMPSDAESISSRPIRRRDRHSSADPSLNERGGKDRMGGHDRSISHDRVERMREKNYERGRDPDRPHHRPRRHKGNGKKQKKKIQGRLIHDIVGKKLAKFSFCFLIGRGGMVFFKFDLFCSLLVKIVLTLKITSFCFHIRINIKTLVQQRRKLFVFHVKSVTVFSR